MQTNRWTGLLLVLGAVAPAALVFPAVGDRLLGHALGEGPSHLWMQWLLDRALWGGHDWFGQADVILDERLWVVPTDWMSRLVVGPLGWLLGRTAAYNLGAVGLLLLAAGGTAQLARQAGAAPWPSALAGLVVVWHPALLGYAADGRFDSLGVGWAALLGAAWLALVRAPSTRGALALAASSAAVALAGVNLAVAAAMTALLPTAAVLLWRPAARRPVLLATALSVAAALPVAAVLLWVEGHDPGRLIQQPHPEGRGLLTAAAPDTFLTEPWTGALALHGPEVSALWSLPAQAAQLPGTVRAAGELIVQVYAPGGWWFLAAVPGALLVAGLLARFRDVAPWAAAAALLQVLALGFGPSQGLPLSLDGSHYTYVAPAVLFERLPVLSAFNNYGLFGTFAAVAVAVGGALGLSALPRRRGLVVLLLAAGWLAEVQLRSPVPLPLPATTLTLPDVLATALSGVPAEQGVLVLPMSQETSYLLQTHHQRPTPVRFRPGVVEAGQDPRLADPNGAITSFINDTARPPAQPRDHRLPTAGVGAVVLLEALLPPGQRARTRASLQQQLGPPTTEADGVLVYTIGP